MKKRSLILRILIGVLIIGAAGLFIYTRIFTWMALVPTSSMSNTIVPGDHVMVNKLFGPPSRGDIVLYQQTKGAERYLSRVVGLPGETIQVQGKSVYVNGRILEEQRVTVEQDPTSLDLLKEISSEGSGPYRVFYDKHFLKEQDTVEEPGGDFGTSTPFRIPDDSYFLLSDNRDNSYDSRYRGAIPRKMIWGRVSIIYYSVKMPLQDEVRWERMFKKVQ